MIDFKIFTGTMHRHEPAKTEKHKISDFYSVGATSYQGRSSHMEDEFKIITNINGRDISLFGVFDGHAGKFAAEYASEVIMPNIANKICDVLNLIDRKIKDLKNSQKPKESDTSENSEENREEEEIENPLNRFITNDNKINYEKLLHEEILENDRILVERMKRALLFCGTTCCIILIDIENKQIICANVGDSRSIMCDTKGNAV